jgi:hypothetical protein
MPQGSKMSDQPTDYPGHLVPPGVARATTERRKVAVIRQLAGLPADQLERALEVAREEKQGA